MYCNSDGGKLTEPPPPGCVLPSFLPTLLVAVLFPFDPVRLHCLVHQAGCVLCFNPCHIVACSVSVADSVGEAAGKHLS